jgi:hypothetical protein
VQGQSLHIQTVKERLTDILQEDSSMRHEIRDAGIEFVDVIIGIGVDIYQFTLS